MGLFSILFLSAPNVQVSAEIIQRIVNLHYDQGGTGAVLHHDEGKQS
jgi:hypothetical protein